jgi:PGDYG protein
LSPTPVPLFRSSGQPGYSSGISNESGRVIARKREREVQVRFTAEACTVQSPEGLVQAKPGDAILTGTGGEHWRVSKARFHDKYRPVPPTRAGEDGAYMSLPSRVLTVQMREDFAVLLADGQSKLNGRAGDWLVDYGDGSLGIVGRAIFPTAYEILD